MIVEAREDENYGNGKSHFECHLHLSVSFEVDIHTDDICTHDIL